MNNGSKAPAYDRQLLLEGAKAECRTRPDRGAAIRDRKLGDPDYVCIYGLRPADWYGRGIRIWGAPRGMYPR